MADIELAQSIQKNKEEETSKKKVEDAKPHPYDVNYGLLKCSLEHIDTKSDEFKVIIHRLLVRFNRKRISFRLFKNTRKIHKVIVNVKSLMFGVLVVKMK